MELYFNCHATNTLFACSNYTLEDGFQIIDCPDGKRKLDGFVQITSPCPHCGDLHRYHSNEIICPMAAQGKDDKE